VKFKTHQTIRLPLSFALRTILIVVALWLAISNGFAAQFFDVATDALYNMTHSDFEKLIVSLPAIDGVFVGEWKFRKFNRHITVYNV